LQNPSAGIQKIAALSDDVFCGWRFRRVLQEPPLKNIRSIREIPAKPVPDHPASPIGVNILIPLTQVTLKILREMGISLRISVTLPEKWGFESPCLSQREMHID